MAGAPHPVQGLRLYPTQLDLVMLEDLGYTVDWTRLPRSPYVSEYPRPQNQKPRSLVGLWDSGSLRTSTAPRSAIRCSFGPGRPA